MTDYPQATPDITEAVKAILENHKGKDNAIKRDHLTFAVFRGECLDYDTNGNEIVIESYDRRIRDALSETAAVNTGTGYFLPTCRDEALQYTASMRSRVKAINRKLAIVDDYIRNLGEYAEQMKLEV